MNLGISSWISSQLWEYDAIAVFPIQIDEHRCTYFCWWTLSAKNLERSHSQQCPAKGTVPRLARPKLRTILSNNVTKMDKSSDLDTNFYVGGCSTSYVMIGQDDGLFVSEIVISVWIWLRGRVLWLLPHISGYTDSAYICTLTLHYRRLMFIPLYLTSSLAILAYFVLSTWLP